MKRSKTSWRMAAMMVGGCLLGGLAVGCSGTSEHREVRYEQTPELMTLSQRPVDYADMRSHTFNANWRMFYEDWSRLWLIDRPSRLTPTPMPH